RDIARLAHILESAELAIGYLGGRSFEDLISDPQLRDALFYRFAIIGESANRIPKNDRLKWPTIPLGEMAGMRNHIVHEYDEIDYHEVHRTITDELPEIVKTLRVILKDFERRLKEET